MRSIRFFGVVLLFLIVYYNSILLEILCQELSCAQDYFMFNYNQSNIKKYLCLQKPKNANIVKRNFILRLKKRIFFLQLTCPYQKCVRIVVIYEDCSGAIFVLFMNDSRIYLANP